MMYVTYELLFQPQPDTVSRHPVQYRGSARRREARPGNLCGGVAGNSAGNAGYQPKVTPERAAGA